MGILNMHVAHDPNLAVWSSPGKKSPFDLTDKTIVVTGGGGILGRGMCAALASQGARVAVVEMNMAAAQAGVDAVLASSPDAETLPIECDVSCPKSVAAMTQAVVDRFGDIHVLCNNAATKGTDLNEFFAPFEEFSLETWRSIMSVNLDGMFLVAQSVGKRMVAQGKGGSIIQTASIYGVIAPDQRIYEGSRFMDRQINTPAVYSASKAGVIGLTKYLASYWGSAGIRVNTISPGGVESGQNETFQQRYSARVPLGRMANKNEIESALVFLASDASGYITGQNLVVDGGLSCW
jgi:NAD(P)-dependent dehydrogenase (short-subunit alcohol dehydrogenase family)